MSDSVELSLSDSLLFSSSNDMKISQYSSWPKEWGDPKTLTPGPWTTLRTGPRTPSTDPPYGPPQKIAEKNDAENINRNDKKI